MGTKKRKRRVLPLPNAAHQGRYQGVAWGRRGYGEPEGSRRCKWANVGTRKREMIRDVRAATRTAGIGALGEVYMAQRSSGDHGDLIYQVKAVNAADGSGGVRLVVEEL